MSIPGAIRFNTDSMKLEYYRGGPVGFGTTTTTGEWVNLTTDSPDIQTGGARGVFGGGYLAPAVNTIEYITISTTGNSLDFGDLTLSTMMCGTAASITRGLFGGGSSFQNTISYVTISSTGNAIDFGDLISARRDLSLSPCSSSTRGLFVGGSEGPAASSSNIIEYVTIASTGNTNDFGDLTSARATVGTCGSSTRAIFGGGTATPAVIVNIIEFATFSTLGNTADFGDLTTARTAPTSSCSNAVRGLFAGGVTPGAVNTIDYITIATLGNAIDFGDLTVVRYHTGAASSSTRGVWGGGWKNPGYDDTFDYVTIMSTGNAVDFGNLLSSRWGVAGLSNGHGGLG